MSDAEDSPVPLVAGRSCGSCIACCVTPRIDSASFNKPANSLCPHCTGTACAIYQTRPAPCRSFFCAWRQSEQMDDSWRPDRSGVILFPAHAPGYGPGLNLMLTDGQASIQRDWLPPLVMRLVRHNRAVMLTINDRQALINDSIAPCLGGGAAAVQAQLLRLYAGAFSGSPVL